MTKPQKKANGKWRVVARYKNIVTGTWTSKTKTFNTAAEARAGKLKHWLTQTWNERLRV